MKRSSVYEAVATVLAFAGVLLFGFGAFPCLNPIQWKFNFGPDYLPASLFSLLGSLPIMWSAWRLSQQGQAIKKEEQAKGSLSNDDPETKR
jgi:hypothetical protein